MGLKIYTSYFYQIRNFTRNMIPISTACSDPAWFHEGTRDFSKISKDKRGIYNGIRGTVFNFKNTDCSDEIICGPACTNKDPTKCAFMREYRKQLEQLDFNYIISELNRIASNIQQLEGFEEEPVIVLIVYEAPTNPCSERVPIQEWFRKNGYNISEWSKI